MLWMIERSTHMEANSDSDSAVANVPSIATMVSVSDKEPSQEVCKTNVYIRTPGILGLQI